MITFRDYQENIIERGVKTLSKLHILLLYMEVRTGKTLTSLGICQRMRFKRVLFITKKKAIPNIKQDYDLLDPDFEITVINFESLHKIKSTHFDCIIIDESHSIGAFPKPSKRARDIKKLFDSLPSAYQINLSGTPTPESYSQCFHQLWVNRLFTPFKETSFYKWANTYVDVRKRYVAHGNMVNDYSNAKLGLIKQILGPYTISLTQQEAGFKSTIQEKVLRVPMEQRTIRLANKLKKDLVLENKAGQIILADTPVKLLQKLHQIYSGTILTEQGIPLLLDASKAQYIARVFKDKKIAIFYKYRAELDMLSMHIPFLTTDIEEFQKTDMSIALQIVSGREGISLKEADCIVYYNIDFSATSYWQSRDRLTTKYRNNNKVYWIFSEKGIEDEIYKKVLKKKNFTTKHFNYDRSIFSKKINKAS